MSTQAVSTQAVSTVEEVSEWTALIIQVWNLDSDFIKAQISHRN